jgi:hypothetical protein
MSAEEFGMLVAMGILAACVVIMPLLGVLMIKDVFG